MRKGVLAVTGCLAILATSGPALRAADSYNLDPAHTAVTFKISHLGLSWTYGRFNDVSGRFMIDSAEPAAVELRSFRMKPESVNTGN